MKYCPPVELADYTLGWRERQFHFHPLGLIAIDEQGVCEDIASDECSDSDLATFDEIDEVAGSEHSIRDKGERDITPDGDLPEFPPFVLTESVNIGGIMPPAADKQQRGKDQDGGCKCFHDVPPFVSYIQNVSYPHNVTMKKEIKHDAT